jgi:hypothetical protein
MSDDELFELLEEARRNNKKLEITGMLLYKGGNFLQMLEGEKEVVKALFQKIKKDSRHKDIVTIMENETEKRTFKSWSMGFVNMDKKGEYPSYKEYINENLNFRDFDEEAEEVYDFICAFDEYNY